MVQLEFDSRRSPGSIPIKNDQLRTLIGEITSQRPADHRNRLVPRTTTHKLRANHEDAIKNYRRHQIHVQRNQSTTRKWTFPFGKQLFSGF